MQFCKWHQTISEDKQSMSNSNYKESKWFRSRARTSEREYSHKGVKWRFHVFIQWNDRPWLSLILIFWQQRPTEKCLRWCGSHCILSESEHKFSRRCKYDPFYYNPYSFLSPYLKTHGCWGNVFHFWLVNNKCNLFLYQIFLKARSFHLLLLLEKWR